MSDDALAVLIGVGFLVLLTLVWCVLPDDGTNYER